MALSRDERSLLLWAARGKAFRFTTEQAHEAIGASVRTIEACERRGLLTCDSGEAKWLTSTAGLMLADELRACQEDL